ncbi:hypothetical protein CHGG_04828 [Chaetomium globosum CBS 148.51]|uniref:Uncharacterized protein n=1 Tax=Chaetomium globosum (strain ATCC 6205 / CBS 148.51 / DSM 1962 / NBRC 6347 / NRRL 1970) TaxID=306901 RepID=Q2H068_CHAGB|nr:uncharacterized protein CHGG_04828 [Chaetomium globosum CBS 148.51]EAQ88209.1 hypothetical protein CHGG_04828 [Chaetomium globosum CBS 148.51]
MVIKSRLGYVQFDIDEDDNFGKTGRVARKKKESRRADRKHLTGNAARELFLECLQLLLRKQVLWLIDYVPKEWRDRLPGWAHHSLLTS